DLDGHECTPMPPVVNSCASKSSNHATQGEGFVELNENSGIPDWYLGEVSAASAEYAAQQAAAQNANQPPPLSFVTVLGNKVTLSYASDLSAEQELTASN